MYRKIVMTSSAPAVAITQVWAKKDRERWGLSLSYPSAAAATTPAVKWELLTAQFNGAQGAGVMIVFSWATMNSRVAGGQPATFFAASARNRSLSPASLYAQT